MSEEVLERVAGASVRLVGIACISWVSAHVRAWQAVIVQFSMIFEGTHLSGGGGGGGNVLVDFPPHLLGLQAKQRGDEASGGGEQIPTTVAAQEPWPPLVHVCSARPEPLL